MKARPLTLGLIALMVFAVTACDWDNAGGSLFDPNYQPERPDPVITSIEPQGWAFGGVGPVTIRGQNFSTTAADNIVLFGPEAGTILEAHSDRIVVRPPETFGADMALRVSVHRALNFARTSYELRRPVSPFGGLTDVEQPRGIGVDGQGNVYVAIFAGNNPGGIVRVNAQGERGGTLHGNPQGWTYQDIAGAADGTIYLARSPNFPVLYRLLPGGGTPAVWTLTANQPVRTVAVDQTGTVWAGGPNPTILRVTSAGVLTQHPFEGEIRTIRVRGNHLYIAAVRGGRSGVWRAPIEALAPGAFTQIFDFGVVSQTQQIQSMAVRADGTVFVSADIPQGIIMIQPDGSHAPLYPSVAAIRPFFNNLAGGADGVIYASDWTGRRLLRIDVRPQGQ